MEGLLRKNVIRDILDAHTAVFFHSDAPLDRLSQRLSTLNTFMAPMATFMRCKTDTAMEQKYSTAIATKDVMDTVETNNDVDGSWLSREDSGTVETPHRKVLKFL